MDAIVTAIVLSLSTNLDNLAVGMTCGVKQFTICLPANLLIAFLSGTSTFVSMLVGDWLEDCLPGDGAQWLGSLILMSIGLLSLAEAAYQANQSHFREEETSSQPHSQHPREKIMSLKRAAMLGLALSASNWGTGIGAGIARLDLGLTSGCSFLSSLLTIGGGALLGKWAIRYLRSDRLTWVAGLLLIALGLYEGI
ncbi:MAG: manganese efflux pump [Cyanobacteria bacterium SBLK]|nr:manganese efflux pump [Cyanobacteria bacterium SBLK]